MKCFQKQPHTQKISAAHFLSEAVAHGYLSEAAVRSLKNFEMFLEAATHIKNMFRSSCTNFSRFLHKIYTLCVKIFHNLSMVMKTSLMVIKPKALHIPWLMLLFHRPAQASYHRLCSGLSYAY